jgi:short-subunit dehydrogenase
MKKENKNKIAIIGHTKGIGKAVASLYKNNGYEVMGFSRSNGYDIAKDQTKIIDALHDCDLVVLNAYSGTAQFEMLKKMYTAFHSVPKKIAVITSTSGTESGIDEDIDNAEYKTYCANKKQLIGYISDMQQDLFNKPLSVYDVCPDVVDTDMIKGMWQNLPKLKTEEVADAVKYCFESSFNVNKIVIQKNAS